jgi:hypothetical protein
MKRIQTKKFHKSWLAVTAITVGSFGPIFALGSVLCTAEPARLTLDILSMPIDGLQSYNDHSTRFLSALTGGFLFGWGITIWCLRKWAYDQASEGVRKAVVVGMLCWFLLDTSGSVLSGNGSNAIFNILILLLAVGPLWQSAKQ